MAIDPIHLNGTMTGVQDYNTMRHQEEVKGMLDQSNFQNQFNQRVDQKLNQVQQKEDMDNRGHKMDAKEKGSNSYAGDGGKNRQKEDHEEERKAQPYIGGGFDMKI